MCFEETASSCITTKQLSWRKLDKWIDRIGMLTSNALPHCVSHGCSIWIQIAGSGLDGEAMQKHEGASDMLTELLEHTMRATAGTTNDASRRGLTFTRCLVACVSVEKSVGRWLWKRCWCVMCSVSGMALGVLLMRAVFCSVLSKSHSFVHAHFGHHRRHQGPAFFLSRRHCRFHSLSSSLTCRRFG